MSMCLFIDGNVSCNFITSKQVVIYRIIFTLFVEVLCVYFGNDRYSASVSLLKIM